MLINSGRQAAGLAALLADRDPLQRGAPCDLTLRLEALKDPKGFKQRHPHPIERPILDRITLEARRLKPICPDISPDFSQAQMAAMAYPDRIALRRKGSLPRYLLSGGKGAILASDDALSTQRLLVATDLDGDPKEARIRTAISISETELRELFTSQLHWQNNCSWSKRAGRVLARSQEHLGAIVLNDRIWKDAPPAATSKAMLTGVRELGLPLSDAVRRFLARVSL